MWSGLCVLLIACASPGCVCVSTCREGGSRECGLAIEPSAVVLLCVCVSTCREGGSRLCGLATEPSAVVLL